MPRAIVSGTGLYTPPYAITNEQLVTSFNEFVAQYNRENAAAIAAGVPLARQLLRVSLDALLDKTSHFELAGEIRMSGMPEVGPL